MANVIFFTLCSIGLMITIVGSPLDDPELPIKRYTLAGSDVSMSEYGLALLTMNSATCPAFNVLQYEPSLNTLQLLLRACTLTWSSYWEHELVTKNRLPQYAVGMLWSKIWSHEFVFGGMYAQKWPE